MTEHLSPPSPPNEFRAAKDDARHAEQIRDLVEQLEALDTERYEAQAEAEQLREELMRCGLLTVSERADGCVPKRAALRIREIAYRTCWPEERSE